ncbi:MAG TPA: nuclear transport factor 2 family protein [Ferruginibacter sp.]|mgnify:CR=1 FL=1|nr:nuclear transport factor 2 family protein [Ferruginibacter sp.]HQY12709.1 nuclear transport factor 2 family protein [Ferruginibacter sp.]
MKKIITILFISVTILSTAKAQSKQEIAVADAVEQMRKAMVDADSAMLDKLSSEKLSYGHSSGHIDDKGVFIRKIISGKSDFVTLELPEQTISVSKNTAIVRHRFNAVTNDNGKPGEVHLSVLQVWQKQHGHWILLARQAVKIQ